MQFHRTEFLHSEVVNFMPEVGSNPDKPAV